MFSRATEIEGLTLVQLEPRGDTRGWFMRTYCHNELAEIAPKPIVQINHSYTQHTATLRGLHYQTPPHAETKIVRCIRGSVFDVVVDIRRGSATCMQWFGVELAARENTMLVIPEGFAHGFQTLCEDCELIYLHTAYYQPTAEAGIAWNDPALNISWPLKNPLVSEKDATREPLPNNFEGIAL